MINSFFLLHYSGEILHISPADSNFSWNLLTLDRNNIVASKNKCSTYQYFGLLKWRNILFTFSLSILFQFPAVQLMFLKSSMEWPLRRQQAILHGVGQIYPAPYSDAQTRFDLFLVRY